MIFLKKIQTKKHIAYSLGFLNVFWWKDITVFVFDIIEFVWEANI